MLVKNTRIMVVVSLFFWAITAGQLGLMAAEDPLDDPLMAEPMLTPDEPEQGDYLGLLDSYEQSAADCGGCGECIDCIEYGDCTSCGEGYMSCDESYPESRSGLYFRADYLMWWTRGARLPPLVTTSDQGTPPGVLGEPTTEVLFGRSVLLSGGRSSFRVRLGYWLDDCQTVALEAEYFDLGEPTARYHATSPGNPILARPYFDVVQGINSSQAIAVPSMAVGDVSVQVSEYFSSVGLRLRTNLCYYEESPPADCYLTDDCGSYGGEYCGDMDDYGAGCNNKSVRFDLIGGYRNLRMTDRVAIREDVVSTGPPNVPGTMFNVSEDFRTSNEFNGGELGLLAQFNRGPWSLDLQATMLMGNAHRVVRIYGSTAITVPGSSTINYPGGLLGQPTNIGMHRDDRFVIIPQFGMELGYQVGSCARMFLGYNLLYWANLARAADQIDLGINPTQIPPGTLVGQPRPRFEFRNGDFWAQGLNVGLEFSF